MKKSVVLIIVLLFAVFNSQGQNLVPNGDFEAYSVCPSGYGQLDAALLWINPSAGWGSPEYYNSCATFQGVSVPENVFGSQFAHSGFGYAGIYLLQVNFSDVREYLEIQLTSPLIPNACYHFEMYVSLGDECFWTCHNIGAYFSNTLISGITNLAPLPFVPQIANVAGNQFDTLSWTLVSGNYTALGGENYIVIGNYDNDLLTDTLLVNTGTQYGGYVYIDDVFLSPCTSIAEQNSNQDIKIYPNPVKDELTISFTPTLFGGRVGLKIFDVLGKVQLSESFKTFGKFTVQTSNYTPGIYFIEINDSKNIYRKKFLKAD